MPSHGNSVQIGDLLKKIVRKAKPTKKSLSQIKRAQKALNEHFGERRRHVSVVSVKTGVVTVEVDGAPLFQEIEGFHRHELVARLQRDGLPVSELRVKLSQHG